MTSQDYVIILLPVPFCPIVYTDFSFHFNLACMKVQLEYFLQQNVLKLAQFGCCTGRSLSSYTLDGDAMCY